jgi:uridine monophosphate synthetase
MRQLPSLISELERLNLIKFGHFTLKSGVSSNVYFDLRSLIAHPALLKDVVRHLNHQIETNIENHHDNIICGVPTTGLQFATTFSILYERPTLMVRPEAKEYGTKKQIEGTIKPGQSVILIDDVITSGTSINNIVDILNKHQIKVEAIVVFIDRRPTSSNSETLNIPVYAVTDLDYIIEKLKSTVSIPRSLLQDEPQVHPKTVILRKIMKEKNSRLCVALDIENPQKFLNMVDMLGPYVCMIKTHIDIMTHFNDFNYFIKTFKSMADKHKFMIFEDRKLSDIGHIARKQLTGGFYKVSEWADFVSCHLIPGPGVLDAFQDTDVGALVLMEMSSEQNLFTDKYRQTTRKFIKKRNVVAGAICQTSKGCLSNDTYLNLTPGVSINESGDKLGQIYRKPSNINKNNIIIIGRAITNSLDVVKTVKDIQKLI